jgi:2-C-methyl-D-erythritol 2,4-cyclodiphosphate synthase
VSDGLPPPFRVGLGHDTHRLGAAGKPLILGGVTIPHDCGLIGHSDADPLLHAITDALLGALALGDIGDWFPNTDPKWQGADSAVFLKEAAAAVISRRYQIVNIDAIVHAERPKLGPHKRAIAAHIAQLLSLPEDRVSVKAKSGEAVGPVGRGEAIQAEAVALLVFAP